ncbi:MAG: hypothetical protein WC742_12585 [Gallionellaceae bacterium]|jgi:hypothetical protein
MNVFATLESRVNAAVAAKFPNATALISSVSVVGTFDAEYQEILGVSAARPTFVVIASALDGVKNGATLAIDCTSLGMVAVPYTVIEVHAEHGMTRLFLRRA